MESDYSDASGNVIFNIPTFSDTPDVYVTATGFNLAPYLYDGLTGIEEDLGTTIYTPGLHAGPSPCFGSLAISYTVPEGVESSLDIYDTAGRMIRRLVLDAGGGTQELVWDERDEMGRPISSGIYYCRLRVPGQNLVQSVVMMQR